MTSSSPRICIIGLGPAGLGAALEFARSSPGRTICIEAGVSPEEKFCSILQGRGCRRVDPCQITSGVGGSSLLSGGKISTYPAGRSMAEFVGGREELIIGLSACLDLFQEYVPLIAPSFSASEIEKTSAEFHKKGFEFRYYDSYLYQQSDLVTGYEQMLRDIRDSGIEVSLRTRVTSIKRTDGRFRVQTQTPSGHREVMADLVLLAVGRSGMTLLNEAVQNMDCVVDHERFDIGVRLEFPAEIWPDIDRCHNDLKLHFCGARTFCVCKRGLLAPYQVDNVLYLEGHADPTNKSDYSNFAITVRRSNLENGEAQSILSEVRRRVIGCTSTIIT